MKVLLSGTLNPRFEALPEYLAAALRRLGNEVTLFDHRDFFLPGRLRSRVAALERFDRSRLNARLLKTVRRLRPDLLIVNQGTVLARSTIDEARALGARCVNWFSDFPAEFETGLEVAPAYDAFFLGSSFAAARHREAGLRRSFWLPFGCDPEQHYFTLKDEHPEDFKRVALFDALLNNTDRKGGHCLVDRAGKIWAIDHGVTFHCEPKLRTVIWDYAGQTIPDAMLKDLKRLQKGICGDEPIAKNLRQLIDRHELEALRGRLDELIADGTFPSPNSDWYTIPWPPV